MQAQPQLTDRQLRIIKRKRLGLLMFIMGSTVAISSTIILVQRYNMSPEEREKLASMTGKLRPIEDNDKPKL